MYQPHMCVLSSFAPYLDIELYQTITDVPITPEAVENIVRFASHIKTFCLAQRSVERVSPLLLNAISLAIGPNRIIAPKLRYLWIRTKNMPTFVRDHMVSENIRDISLPRSFQLDFLNGLNITEIIVNVHILCELYPFPPPYALQLPSLRKVAFSGWDTDISRVLFTYFPINQLEHLQITFRGVDTSSYIYDPKTFVHQQKWFHLTAHLKTLSIREHVFTDYPLPNHICAGAPGWQLPSITTKYRVETVLWFWCGCDGRLGCSNDAARQSYDSPFLTMEEYFPKRPQDDDPVFRPNRTLMWRSNCYRWVL